MTLPERPWEPLSASGTHATGGVAATVLGSLYGTGETWEGFGGCFNELGWQALRSLAAPVRGEVLDQLFGPKGLALDLGRVPMGASDYAAEWHSYAEERDDYRLETFSIERDQRELIPFVHEALERRPDLRLCASPWSPPTWMKHPAVHNFGRFRMEERCLSAYADYFVRFIDAYRESGVQVLDVHPQNEPVADQKFPSCVWEGEQLRVFLGEYLGPALARMEKPGRLWLGTMNSADFCGMFLPVLADPACRRYLHGVGLQWAGKGVAHRLRQLAPTLPIWQTENECGDGANSWDYAHYVFDLILHYLDAGCSGYLYWNLVLPPGGMSSWGWKQNTLVTVEPETGRWRLNPEYHVLRHFSAFIRPGARRLRLTGTWAGCAAAFVCPDRSVVVVLHNPTLHARRLHLGIDAHEVHLVAPPRSMHTLVWS